MSELDNILAIADKMDAGEMALPQVNESQESRAPRGGNPYGQNISSGDLDSFLSGLGNRSNPEIDALYNSIDQQYNGVMPTAGGNRYNVDEAMERQQALYEGKGKITESAKNIPSAIFQSIMSQPLNLDPSIMQDHKIDELGEKLQPGFDRFAKINEELEKRDNSYKQQKMKIQNEYVNDAVYGNGGEAKQTVQYNTGNIDYALIKTIVKECLAEMKADNTNTCGIMLSTDTGFKFRDAQNNIFECTMTYVGKSKNKK